MKNKSNPSRIIVYLIALALFISLWTMTVLAAGNASTSLAGGVNFGIHTQDTAQPATREIIFTHSYSDLVTVRGAVMDGRFFEFYDESIERDMTNIPANSPTPTGMFVRPTLEAMNTPGLHTVTLRVNYDVHQAGQRLEMRPGRYEVSMQLEIYIATVSLDENDSDTDDGEDVLNVNINPATGR